MEITYSLEQKDITHFQNYCLDGGKKGGRYSRYAWLLGLFAMGAFASALSDRRPGQALINVRAVLMNFAMIFVCFVIAFLLIRWRQKREKKTPSVLLQTQTLRMSESGLSIQSTIDNTHVAWSHLYQIDADETHIYFLLSKNRGYILPKRVFASIDEERRFYEMAQAWCNQAEKDPSVGANVPSFARSSNQRQVRYTMDEADLAHGLRFIGRHPKGRSGQFRIILAFVVVVVASAFSALSTGRSASGFQLEPILISLIPIVIVGGFVLYLYYRGNARMTKKSIPELAMMQTVTFDPERIAFATSVAETVVLWNNLAEVTADDRLLYFITPERQAYMTPRSAFASLEDSQEFYTLARLCWENAKAGTPLSELPLPQSWPPPPVT